MVLLSGMHSSSRSSSSTQKIVAVIFPADFSTPFWTKKLYDTSKSHISSPKLALSKFSWGLVFWNRALALTLNTSNFFWVIFQTVPAEMPITSATREKCICFHNKIKSSTLLHTSLKVASMNCQGLFSKRFLVECYKGTQRKYVTTRTDLFKTYFLLSFIQR